MKNKIIQTIIILIAVFITLIALGVIQYRDFLKENAKEISACTMSNDDYFDCEKGIDNCYKKMYNLLIPHLLVNKAYADGKPLKFEILLPSYVCPTVALEQSDALMSYGVFQDMLAENKFVNLYDAPSYSFDCGISSYKLENENCHFESSCIGTDEFILKEENQISSGKIHTFAQKLKELKLDNKMVFVKMDIAGAEGYILPDLIKSADNITGMSICFRFKTAKEILKDISVLEEIEKDFVLVARADHSFRSINKKTCRYMSGDFSEVIVLTFINKNLIDRYHLDFNQTSTQTFDKGLNWFKQEPTKIDETVVIYKKIKNLKRKLCKRQ